MRACNRTSLMVLVAAIGGVGMVLSVGAGDSSGPFLSLPENPMAGGRLFMEKGCVACHAVHGVGGTAGPDLGRVPAAWSFLGIAGVMWNHSPKMDAEFRRRRITRPELSSDEMFKLIAFVYSLNYFGSTGDPDEGERLLLRKRCLECHSVGNHGAIRESVPLDRFQANVSPAYIAAALWNASRDMTAQMRQQGIPRPVYGEHDLVNILAFIRREAKPENAGTTTYLPLGNAKNGAELFRNKGCIRCHAVRGEGGNIGPDLGVSRSGDVVSQLAGAMWNHGPEMWQAMAATQSSFPELTSTEMSDLITYLHFSSFADPAGDPKVGQRLFEEKGCGTCHGLVPEDDSLGLPVAEMEFRTAPDVIAAMWNHTLEMEQAAEAAEIAWPQFRPGEMEHLVAFIKARIEAGSRVTDPGPQ